MFQSHLVDELEKRVFGVAISICCVESLHDAAQHNGVHLPAGDRQSAQHTQHEPSLKMDINLGERETSRRQFLSSEKCTSLVSTLLRMSLQCSLTSSTDRRFGSFFSTFSSSASFISTSSTFSFSLPAVIFEDSLKPRKYYSLSKLSQLGHYFLQEDTS